MPPSGLMRSTQDVVLVDVFPSVPVGIRVGGGAGGRVVAEGSRAPAGVDLVDHLARGVVGVVHLHVAVLVCHRGQQAGRVVGVGSDAPAASVALVNWFEAL